MDGGVNLENLETLLSAGANIIRFVPPLVIEKKDVDEMIAILTEAMKENGLQ